MFLDKSAEPRDIEQDGSRFWVTDLDHLQPAPAGYVGVVDEEEGGIVVHVHESNADRLVEAFRAFTGEDDVDTVPAALRRIEASRPCLDAETTDADLADWCRRVILPELEKAGLL